MPIDQLQALFVEEAKKYDVFPLDPQFFERIDSRALTRPRWPRARSAR
jgi:hypothetical protein